MKNLQTQTKPENANLAHLRAEIMAYYDMLTVMKSQAEAFDIQLDCLDKENLEEYLY